MVQRVWKNDIVKKVAGGARNKAIYPSDKPQDPSIDDLTQWSGV